VKQVGLDWAYRQAQWCALSAVGEVAGEGRIVLIGMGLLDSSWNWAMR